LILADNECETRFHPLGAAGRASGMIKARAPAL
jgi:hypothetical protein